MKARPCKEAGDDRLHAKRPAPYAGPRCATCHRAVSAARRMAAHGAYLLRTYNVTLERYWELHEAQGGACAICQRATGKARRLAVDHDHACCPGPRSCGACVRGLLCGPCNQLLGRMRDAPAVFERAATYLRKGRTND